MRLLSILVLIVSVVFTTACNRNSADKVTDVVMVESLTQLTGALIKERDALKNLATSHRELLTAIKNYFVESSKENEDILYTATANLEKAYTQLEETENKTLMANQKFEKLRAEYLK